MSMRTRTFFDHLTIVPMMTGLCVAAWMPHPQTDRLQVSLQPSILSRLLGCCCLLAFLMLPSAVTAQDTQRNGLKVVGYLPDYRVAKFNPDYAAGLTDVILFAIEPTASGEINEENLSRVDWKLFQEFKKNSGTRLIVCMGGWGRSDHFAVAVQDPRARKNLVSNCLRYLQEHRLDGLDLDWEHPKNQLESEAYARLIVDLKQAFQPHQLTVSVTIAPWQNIPDTGYAAADWVQLMSYDYGQRHATLEQAQKDVDLFLSKGIPSEKIILGIPFYGRNIDDRSQALMYSQIRSRFQPAVNQDETNGFFYNSPATVRRKTRIAIDHQLGGVMIWEIGQDTEDESSLLKAINDEISTPVSSRGFPAIPLRNFQRSAALTP